MNLCQGDSEYENGVRRSMSEPFRPLNHHQDCGCPYCRERDDRFMSWTQIACRVVGAAAAALAVIEVVARLCIWFHR
jgi:hypothetical protein